ncbi:MAG: DUF2922 domain-containing protein [Synergistaceae bacterium]|nr:DUF2922 domain-containing protein [Synergistaceae bacterium]
MKTLRMTFGTPVANETLLLSLPYPKEGLTQAEIETAMQAVIDHGIFVAGPNSRLGADIVDRTVTVVFGD